MAQKLTQRVDRLEEAAIETQRKIQRTEDLIYQVAETDAERGRKIDERIGALVIAIGGLIQRMDRSLDRSQP